MRKAMLNFDRLLDLLLRSTIKGGLYHVPMRNKIAISQIETYHLQTAFQMPKEIHLQLY